MEVSFTKIDKLLCQTTDQFELVVSGLTMRELHKLVEDNFHRRLGDGAFCEVFLCYLVAKSAIAKNLKISYEDVCVGYEVVCPTDASMKLISTIVENLKLNKKTRMVANTAIDRWGQDGAVLMTYSQTVTWQKYIRSLMIDTENYQVEVRRKMVQEAFENNPDQVFPDMEYMVYKRY
jgi:hypothetical protein